MSAKSYCTKTAVIIGATSKWNRQFNTASQPRNLDPARMGLGGALTKKFCIEGYQSIVTSRKIESLSPLVDACADLGGAAIPMEMEVTCSTSVSDGFKKIVAEYGVPDIVIFNTGFSAGRELGPEAELLENVPDEVFDAAISICGRALFNCAKFILPYMRKRGSGSFFVTNNYYALHGRKRHTGESLYYPRALMRTLCQVLSEEYGPLGIHTANIVIDGMIESYGTSTYSGGIFRDSAQSMLDAQAIAEAYWYLHNQHPSCWSHEIQLTPNDRPISR